MHEGAGRGPEVQRREPIQRLRILGELVAIEVEQPRRHVGLARDLAPPRRELDAPRAAERIERDPRQAAIDLQLAQLVLFDERIAGRVRHEGLLKSADRIRRLVDRGAPVPSVGAIQVQQRAAGFVEAAGRLNVRRDDVIAQDVAENHPDAAAHVRAKRIDADTHDRLTDVVRSQVRTVRLRLERRRLRQAGGVVVEERVDGPLSGGARRQDAGVARQAGCERARHRLGRVERVDVVAVLFVHAERDARAGHRQRGTEIGDAGRAGEQIRHLRHVPAVGIHPIHVRDSLTIGDEEQRTSVGGPLRVDVLRGLEPAQRAHVAARDVEQRDARAARVEAAEVRAEAIGREGNRAAIGRPRRRQLGVRVARQSAQLIAIEIVHI